jgi:hypothetical protein
MAPTPRNNHELAHAGVRTESIDSARGRRYFSQMDSAVTNHDQDGYGKGDNTCFGPKDSIPNAFCKDTTQRTGDPQDNYCGLSSRELAFCHNLNHRRGRRPIDPCGFQGSVTPSAASCASEAFSEASADRHLGPRQKFKDERWKASLELDSDMKEPMGGLSSHNVALSHRLGRGKRHFGAEIPWVGIHKFVSIADPGGADVEALERGSFLGPKKRPPPGANGMRPELADDVFCDKIEAKDMFRKKLFSDKYHVIDGSQDVPLGVSTQIDLHTRGFLGKSKANFGGMAHKSSDPISDLSHTPRDPHDLASYGLNMRGKRKFLVQNNLEPGCRHNMSRPEMTYSSTLGRSASAPIFERDLPPNETPYYQDDLPEEQRAVKSELGPCRGNTERERTQKNRNSRPDVDHMWSATGCHTTRGFGELIDSKSAAKFIEGQDAIHAVTDEEHRELEMRNSLGKTKRSFGNAHNKSDFRFDHNDSAEYRGELFNADGRRWGAGHGRKRFDERDHLDRHKAEDGGEDNFVSANGTILGKGVKHKMVEDHLDPDAAAENIFTYIDSKGNARTPRQIKKIKDNVEELMVGSVASEDSNTLGVAGIRRKTELIRPKSARRFPQKDGERVTPRSATPRAASQPHIKLDSRPLWHK